MQGSAQRAAHWLGVVGELLKQPLTQVPYATICEELAATFDVVRVSWNWRDEDGSFGFELFPSNVGHAAAELLPLWLTEEFLECHPLLRWFGATQDPRPQSIGRVPSPIAVTHGFHMIDGVLRQLDSEQQLSIPYRLTATGHRAFILQRAGQDFDDDDIELARLLQPILQALDQQSQILAAAMPRLRTSSTPPTAELTGREMAVLRLLAEGYTAASIARRLSNAPRTVQKHLEHIYRKLNVRDRLGAIRAADELNLIPDLSRPREQRPSTTYMGLRAPTPA